jgi:hypothetical protein
LEREKGESSASDFKLTHYRHAGWLASGISFDILTRPTLNLPRRASSGKSDLLRPSALRVVKIRLISRRTPREGGGYNAELEDRLGEFSGPLVLTDQRVLDQFGPDSLAYFEIEIPFRIGNRFL